MQILGIFALGASAALCAVFGSWVGTNERFEAYGEVAWLFEYLLYAIAIVCIIATTFQVREIMDGLVRKRPARKKPRRVSTNTRANRLSMNREQARTDWPGYDSHGRPRR